MHDPLDAKIHPDRRGEIVVLGQQVELQVGAEIVDRLGLAHPDSEVSLGQAHLLERCAQGGEEEAGSPPLDAGPVIAPVAGVEALVAHREFAADGPAARAAEGGHEPSPGVIAHGDDDAGLDFKRRIEPLAGAGVLEVQLVARGGLDFQGGQIVILADDLSLEIEGPVKLRAEDDAAHAMGFRQPGVTELGLGFIDAGPGHEAQAGIEAVANAPIVGLEEHGLIGIADRHPKVGVAAAGQRAVRQNGIGVGGEGLTAGQMRIAVVEIGADGVIRDIGARLAVGDDQADT